LRSVSADFLAALQRPDSKTKYAVYYKRRYWQGNRSFAWESSWTALPVSDLVSVSPVTWKLDTDNLTEFKVSNVSIVLDNSYNKYDVHNPFGFFRQDTASPVYGYEPYLTKFQIRAGYELNSGTDELVTLFTGVYVDHVMDSESKTIQLEIHGLEELLVNKKAERIATTVTEENAGSGNNVTTVFSTANSGVGGITEVSVAGIKKIEGSDYTVSRLNSATQTAQVTFAVAPVTGSILISYFYWAQNISFASTVSALLTAAGIDAGNQSVSPVIFSSAVLNAQTYTSQADWVAGTKTIIDTSSNPGSIIPDWEDASLRTATGWDNSISGWTAAGTAGKWTSDGTKLICSAPATEFQSGRIYRAMNKVVGSWHIAYTMPSNPVPFEYSFIATAAARSLGYTVALSYGGAGFEKISLLKDGVSVGSSTNAAYVNTTGHDIVITRTNLGRIRIYWDGTLIIDYTDLSITSGSYIYLYRGFGASNDLYIDQISVPPDTASVIWESGILDAGSTPTAWGTYDVTKSAGGATIQQYLDTSSDNFGTHDGYVEITGTTPTSTLRRYFKTKVIMTLDLTQMQSPEVFDVTLRWTTSSVLITLPDFAGISIYEAIQKIGEYAIYEFGFTPDEVFFFRPKDAGASVMTLTEADYVKSISSYDSGNSRVYGIVRVTYGSITKEVTDPGSEPNSPVARVSDRRYDFQPDDAIVIASTADIATGVAAKLYSIFSKARRRAKIKTKFIPQLDLSDVITVRLVNNTPDIFWEQGDPNFYLGEEGIHHWGSTDQIVYNVRFKIIGARYDPERDECDFDIEEVL
jgi:hypothetical protein